MELVPTNFSDHLRPFVLFRHHFSQYQRTLNKIPEFVIMQFKFVFQIKGSITVFQSKFIAPSAPTCLTTPCSCFPCLWHAPPN
jgi:hypothetical protein